MATHILSPPVLAGGFRGIVQPFTIREQADQFDGAKEFDRAGLWPPNARSFPALTRMATSSVEQFRSFATWADSGRAGKSLAAQVVIAVCVTSSVITSSFLFAQDPNPIKAARPGLDCEARWRKSILPALPRKNHHRRF